MQAAWEIPEAKSELKKLRSRCDLYFVTNGQIRDA